MGISPQSGLPQNNRVGDFDPFALPLIMQQTGKSLPKCFSNPGQPERAAGLSGVSGDFRDIAEAAAKRQRPGASWPWTSSPPACGTIWGLTWSNWAGPTRSFSPAASARTGPTFRAERAAPTWSELGIVLDPAANQSAHGEMPIHAEASRVQIWVVPTNEELIVARQAKRTPRRKTGALAPCLSPKSPARWLPRRRSASMVGHKLLVVEPYRLDPQGRSTPGHHRAVASWPSIRWERARASSC